MERFSAKAISTICSAVAGLGLVAMSQVDEVWLLYSVSAVFGGSLAFLLYRGFTTLLSPWLKTRMGILIGICSAGSGIGGILFSPFGGYLISGYGWRRTNTLLGMMKLVLASPVLGIFLRNYSKDKGLTPYGYNSGNALNKQISYSVIEHALAIRMPIF